MEIFLGKAKWDTTDKSTPAPLIGSAVAAGTNTPSLTEPSFDNTCLDVKTRLDQELIDKKRLEFRQLTFEVLSQINIFKITTTKSKNILKLLQSCEASDIIPIGKLLENKSLFVLNPVLKKQIEHYTTHPPSDEIGDILNTSEVQFTDADDIGHPYYRYWVFSLNEETIEEMASPTPPPSDPPSHMLIRMAVDISTHKKSGGGGSLGGSRSDTPDKTNCFIYCKGISQTEADYFQTAFKIQASPLESKLTPTTPFVTENGVIKTSSSPTLFFTNTPCAHYPETASGKTEALTDPMWCYQNNRIVLYAKQLDTSQVGVAPPIITDLEAHQFHIPVKKSGFFPLGKPNSKDRIPTRKVMSILTRELTMPSTNEDDADAPPEEATRALVTTTTSGSLFESFHKTKENLQEEDETPPPLLTLGCRAGKKPTSAYSANNLVNDLLECGQLKKKLPHQEWCHLKGHGDGGEDKPENLISGSHYANTEQLAIETGLRTAIEFLATTHKKNSIEQYSAHVSASNFLSELNHLAKLFKYEIFYCHEKEWRQQIFCHIFDGQSTSFDYNEFKILSYHVQRAILYTSLGLPGWLEYLREKAEKISP